MCTGSQGGAGIQTDGWGVGIRNGNIIGTGSHGVRGHQDTQLERLEIEHHASHGVYAVDGSSGWAIRDCIVQYSGGSGPSFASGGSGMGSSVRNSAIRHNAGFGITGGFSLVSGNFVTGNGGLGLSLGYDGVIGNYTQNVIAHDNGGYPNRQVNGGFAGGGNVCGNPCQ